MFATAIIVFRETLEAALFVGIMAAATRGLAGRIRWLITGVLAGSAGALALAVGAGHISALANGVGQDLVNAGILVAALTMLTWHCVWVSNQGAQAAADACTLGSSFKQGQRAPWALTIVVALSVLREGAETVLFVAGYATGSGSTGTLVGALAGVLCGSAMGAVIYLGLSRVPVQRMFAMTNTLILLLAASIASQLARALSQAGLVSAWGQPLWDTSPLLRVDSPFGTLAHALVGYEAQPTGLQLAFYALALLVIFSGSRWVRGAHVRRRTAVTMGMPTGT
ncbi:MAG: iron permease [Candidimonas sp.]|nr:MAG: iron permease [Candidimonas sp.]TAM24947.1 MAG: iron permease [Candidimonas sp.]